jgi:hypothetical protein
VAGPPPCFKLRLRNGPERPAKRSPCSLRPGQKEGYAALVQVLDGSFGTGLSVSGH